LPGPIYHKDGRLLGQHQGLAFYTIGQLKGLPSTTEALYFIDKRKAENSLIVGFLNQLARSNLFLVEQVNWIWDNVHYNRLRLMSKSVTKPIQLKPWLNPKPMVYLGWQPINSYVTSPPVRLPPSIRANNFWVVV
jgi:tRNA-specific 2-thiouridylase